MASFYARVLGRTAASLSRSAARASTQASYTRRMDEWQLQARLAQKGINQCEKQIAAANIKVESAKKDLEALDK
jgi:hypothetical protein